MSEGFVLPTTLRRQQWRRRADRTEGRIWLWVGVDARRYALVIASVVAVIAVGAFWSSQCSSIDRPTYGCDVNSEGRNQQNPVN
jgi:hypothetical protein